jgi:class 3 adenylate cyclase/tetratricopeptide (TPR) repeat protein
MRCASCGADNDAGRKFCGECGSSLSVACPACGSPNAPMVKFCGDCGSPLAGDVVARLPAAAAQPTAERRLVSVLFADLVGFTTLSESRDAEEVRELLSSYFDTCRRLIGLYGGTVEKFIGDAVMAVWGTPVATEQDAERAVRAALDLTAAVAALGEEVGAPELAARAGVLTGEAAVTIGAEAQGMVAGDLVNTASRIQSVAEAGSVYVGEATKRTSEDTVVYEDAGTFELKGKAEPVPLWRAVRVVAGANGTMRSAGLESPFVGRDRELRMIKGLFHATAEERRAHLVSVVGVPGTGKSRLAWEFFKYIDGLADTVRWHRGRCLPYGEGVTYWALAEMVRTRAGILEGEDSAQALEKLKESLRESLSDREEREWVEPRLAQLLGLEERASHEREDLFAAWRLFYERLSEEMPTVMVFEDIHWADSALLEFVEYLMEWSRDYRLFVITLSRPELLDQRPTWGTATRNFTSMHLESLGEPAMKQMLDGLAPGLPDDLRTQILERAAGVPLYAMETIRMLLDRGALTLEGSAYRATGAIGPLDIPESLHALIASRLDGLAPEERRLVQDGSVLGKTFKREALASLSGMTPPELEPVLASLVRKEVLFVQADPRSPERGQFGFLQDLVRRVAYETLSKRERKAKHLAAVASLGSIFEADEAIEIVASHYLEAYQAAPEAEDAGEIRSKAGDALANAGERAASLGASAGAQRYFEQAADLADDDRVKAGFLERAGVMALRSSRYPEAIDRLGQAADLFERAGEPRLQARASAALAEAEWYGESRIEEPLRRMEAAFEVLNAGEPDEAVAALAHEIARFHYFAGHVDASGEWVERSLAMAESLWLPEVLSHVLNTKSLLLRTSHPEQAMALLVWSIRIAEEHDLTDPLIRALNNLGVSQGELDRYEEALGTFHRQLELSRRLGMHQPELVSEASAVSLQIDLGEWDEALEVAERLLPEVGTAARDVSELLKLTIVHAARGEPERGRAIVDALSSFAESEETQIRAAYDACLAVQLFAEGDPKAALVSGERAIETVEAVGINSDVIKLAYVWSLEAAAALGDNPRVEELVAGVEAIPPGLRSPMYRAQATRFRARLAATTGQADPEGSFKSAAGLFRELGTPFWLAVTLLEHGELLVAHGRAEDAQPLLDEAGEILERLRARPWLRRLERLSVSGAPVSAS